MDLNLVRVFVRVAQHGSFTAAARELGQQRSVTSRKVSALERELGVTLLHRSTRRVTVTTAGQRLLRDVEPLLGRLESLLDGLPERSPEPAGELRITAPADLGAWLLPDVLAGLVERYPAVLPIVDLTNRVVDLELERVDVALRMAPNGLRNSDLRARRLGHVRFGLYAGKSYLARTEVPTTVADLTEHIVIDVVEAEHVLGVQPRRRIRVRDMVLGTELAAHDVGVALLPCFYVDAHHRRGHLTRLLSGDEFGCVPLFLVFPPHPPAKTEAFRDAVVSFIADHPLD